VKRGVQRENDQGNELRRIGDAADSASRMEGM